MATLTVEGISPLLQHMILPAAILREEASGCRSEGERERGVGISPNMKIAANLPQLCHMRSKERCGRWCIPQNFVKSQNCKVHSEGEQACHSLGGFVALADS